MIADTLLERLDKVRSNGPGKWMACCPAHGDRSPSLSIRESDDRVLIHCFSQHCEPNDIMAAVGLSLSDLFNTPKEHRRGPLRDRKHQHMAGIALRTLAYESLVIELAATRLANGHALDEANLARMKVAAERVRAIAGLVT